MTPCVTYVSSTRSMRREELLIAAWGMLGTFGHLPFTWLLFAVLAAAGFVAFFVGRTEAVATARGTVGRLHSQPNYHGYFVAMATIAPAAIIFIIYALAGDPIVRSQLASELPQRIQDLSQLELNQYLDRISENVARGDATTTGNALFDAASQRYTELLGLSRIVATLLAILFAAGGFFIAKRKVSAEFRARPC